jgi:hypothetical protein
MSMANFRVSVTFPKSACQSARGIDATMMNRSDVHFVEFNYRISVPSSVEWVRAHADEIAAMASGRRDYTALAVTAI